MKKNRKEIILALILAVVVFTMFGLYFIIKVRTSSSGQNTPVPNYTPSPTRPTTETLRERNDIQVVEEEKRPTDAPADKVILKVTYNYVVKNVSEPDIVLEGERGEFRVPKDPNLIKLTVQRETNGTYSPLTPEDVKAGDSIRMEMIPGEHIWLYIIE